MLMKRRLKLITDGKPDTMQIRESVMQINGNYNSSFGSGVHVYFYTSDGKRIVSDANMKKCIHYMEAHLNNSKRVKVKNQDLIDTYKFGQVDKATGERIGGDKDYYNISHIRTVLDNTKDKVEGFIKIVSGKDSVLVSEEYGKGIGRAKGLSKKRIGRTDSFETSHAVKQYISKAPEHAEKNPVMRDGERQAFGIIINPTKVDNDGIIQKFDYVRSGYFPESRVN